MQQDEWTEVTAKGKRKKGENASKRSESVTAKVKPKNPPSRTVTPAKIQTDFNGKMKVWQASSCRKTLLATLDRIGPDGGWDIRQAVCVGSGSFSRDNVECRKRSLWQLVVFYDLVRELQTRTRKMMDIEIYAQEPQFTDLDKSWLAMMRINILESDQTAEQEDDESASADRAPRGDGLGPAKELLNHSTFLYEPFMDLTAQMACEILDADPALYIGSSMRGLMAKRGEAGDLAKRFDAAHEKYQFPNFEEDPNVLEGLGIYWKPDKDSG